MFYFAYVDDGHVAFNPAVHNREDEFVFDFKVEQSEAQVATATITILNPRIGPLNPTRKIWAWLSMLDEAGTTVVPVFLGVLVGVPADISGELVTFKYNARPHEYIQLKQACAETLRVAPFYYPIYLDFSKRDDPDAILEGHSKLYHVDRLTHAVTASDILEGEDGTIDFTADKAFYDTVKMELGQCPLERVRIISTAKWTQRYTGFVSGPDANISSYTGGSFKGDWPKAGTNLGGGWSVSESFVWDVLDTEHARTFNTNYNWTNTDPEAGDCSTASVSYNSTGTTWPNIAIEGSGGRKIQTGVCDPFAFGSFSDGAPMGVNIPAKVEASGNCAVLWVLNCTMKLKYQAKREFEEQVTIDVSANVQNTMASPTTSQNTETIKVGAVDVGVPLETPNAWSDFANAHVDVGTIVYPNDANVFGGSSFQIAVTSGTAGATQPSFSDIPGTITVDNTVHWASMGESPPTTQPQWTNSTDVALGEIFIVEPKKFNLTTGDMELTGDAFYFLCTGPGETNKTFLSMEYLPSLISNSQGVEKPVPFTTILGPGDVATSNIGGQGGSGPAIPATGSTLTDGSVTWLNLGKTPPGFSIPIGGTMTNVSARNFFSTDEGKLAIQYQICKARARLRIRARCVKLQWDASIFDCLTLSCRKNATIFDPRIPGGAATGKIVNYSLSADRSGKRIGHVEIGAAVGLAGSVSAVAGTPEYAAPGYMQLGYQAYDGGQYVTGEEDISYTPPTFAAYDDGLVFPLQTYPGTINIVRPIQHPEVVAALAQVRTPELASLVKTINGYSFINQSLVDWIKGGEATYQLEISPVAAEILIQPVTNGPFTGSISVTCSQLELPKGIDLEAGSQP